MPTWQSILWIFQVFFARWCGIMASKKSFLRMTIIVPSASAFGRRGRLKGPSAPSGMWSSTTSILLLYLLVLEVAAFQQNFGKIGKSELLLLLSLGWQSSRALVGLGGQSKLGAVLRGAAAQRGAVRRRVIARKGPILLHHFTWFDHGARRSTTRDDGKALYFFLTQFVCSARDENQFMPYFNKRVLHTFE